MYKLLLFVRRKSGLTWDEFSTHWRDVHGPIVTASPEMMRHVVYYVQHHARPNPRGGEGYDGVAEIAFRSKEAAKAFFAEPIYTERLKPDEATFLDTDGVTTLVVDDLMFAGTYAPGLEAG